MKYIDQLAFRCRSCNEPLLWGQKACPKCGEQVLKGLPKWIDQVVGFLIYLVVVLFLFALISAVLHDLPVAARLAIAIVVGSIKFKVAPGMGFNPKRAHIKLDIGNLSQIFSDSDRRVFDFRPKKWLATSTPEGDIFSILMDGVTSIRDMTEILGYIPEDEAVEGVHELIQDTDDENTMLFGVRSLVRIGNQKAKDILWKLQPDKVKHLLENSKAFSEADKSKLRTIMSKKPALEAGETTSS